MLRHSEKSLACQDEVWILLKSGEAEGNLKAQLSDTRNAEKTLCLGSFGILGGLACHPDSFAGATDPAFPGHLCRGITATSALYLSRSVPPQSDGHSINSQICRKDWTESRKPVKDGPVHSSIRKGLDEEKPWRAF